MLRKRALHQHIDRCALRGYDTEILPEKLEINFFVDYDIVSLHTTMNKIIKKFQQEKLKAYNEERKTIAEELSRFNYIYKIRVLVNRDNELAKEIESINNNEYLNKFNSDAQEFLTSYLEVKSSTPYIEFGQESQYILTNDDFQRISAISNFLLLCRKFIPVTLNQRIYTDKFCRNCKKIIDKYINGNDIEYCPHCLCEQVAFSLTVVKDNDKSEVDIVTDNSGDTFLSLFNRDNGKGCESFGEEQMTLLDNYFISIGKKSGEYYRNLSDEYRDAKGRPFDTSIAELRKALNFCNLKKYQNDVRVIASIYWSYTFVDHSLLRDAAMNLYSKLNEAYNRVPFKRKSNLGNHWYLVRIYELLGVEVNEKDYKIPKSPKSYSIHRDCWNAMCVLLSSDPDIRNLLT